MSVCSCANIVGKERLREIGNLRTNGRPTIILLQESLLDEMESIDSHQARRVADKLKNPTRAQLIINIITFQS